MPPRDKLAASKDSPSPATAIIADLLPEAASTPNSIKLALAQRFALAQAERRESIESQGITASSANRKEEAPEHEVMAGTERPAANKDKREYY